MITIKLKKDDLKRIQSKLKKITKLREPLALIRDALEASTKLRFNNNKDPEGDPWVKRSDKYLERLRKQGKNLNRILFVSGDLQKSIKYLSDDKKVVVGTNIIYATTHQFGYKKKNIPKREFIGLSDLDKQRIDEIIEKHIEK